MHRLLILENTDQERYGLDTVIMVVPEQFDENIALEESGLEKPIIVSKNLTLYTSDHIVQLGEYRPFIG